MAGSGGDELLGRMRAIGRDYGSDPQGIPVRECLSAALRVVLRAALEASAIFSGLGDRDFRHRLNSLEVLARGGRPSRTISVESALVTAAVSKTLGVYGSSDDIGTAREMARWVEGDYASIMRREHYDADALVRATRVAASCAEAVRSGYDDAGRR